MQRQQFVLVTRPLFLVFVLLGSVTPASAQGSAPYSINVTPTSYMIPSLRWVITNVTTEVVEWGWGSGKYWTAKAGQHIIFEVHEVRDNEVHGQFTIGNLTIVTNDSRIAAELTFSIWPWFPGLVSHLDWQTVDHNATHSVTGYMEGNLEIQTTTSTKTYTYHQGAGGNQNTTLVYDINTGILRTAYTEIFFANDYHLGLQLISTISRPTSLTLLIVSGGAAIVFVTILVLVQRRR